MSSQEYRKEGSGKCFMAETRLETDRVPARQSLGTSSVGLFESVRELGAGDNGQKIVVRIKR